MVYGVAALDASGRIADSGVVRALDWVPGTRLHIHEGAGLAVLRADRQGVFTVTGQGHLRQHTTGVGNLRRRPPPADLLDLLGGRQPHPGVWFLRPILIEGDRLLAQPAGVRVRGLAVRARQQVSSQDSGTNSRQFSTADAGSVAA